MYTPYTRTFLKHSSLKNQEKIAILWYCPISLPSLHLFPLTVCSESLQWSVSPQRLSRDVSFYSAVIVVSEIRFIDQLVDVCVISMVVYAYARTCTCIASYFHRHFLLVTPCYLTGSFDHKLSFFFSLPLKKYLRNL